MNNNEARLPSPLAQARAEADRANRARRARRLREDADRRSAGLPTIWN